jgi:transposase
LKDVVENHLFIGIDVSKAKLDAALRPGAESFSVANNHRGIATLIKQLKKLSVSRMVLEASGGYEIAAASELAAAGLPVGQYRPFSAASKPRRNAPHIENRD